MCLSKYVKVCFIGTIITTVSDVLSLVTRNYPTVCVCQYRIFETFEIVNFCLSLFCFMRLSKTFNIFWFYTNRILKLYLFDVHLVVHLTLITLSRVI